MKGGNGVGCQSTENHIKMPRLQREKPGIATKGGYDSALLHSGGCRLFVLKSQLIMLTVNKAGPTVK
jgi:hypothetical protein